MTCHPFFTGEQKFVDTAGRVEKFKKRFGGTQARRASKKVETTEAADSVPAETEA